MLKQRKMWRILTYLALATVATYMLAGCGSSSSDPIVPAVTIEPTVQVTDTAGDAVVGATVYAIPAADVTAIAAEPITLGTDGNYTAASQNVDEPLEDLINGNFTPAGSGVTTYVSGTTDATGKALLSGLPVGAADMYFIYVTPATTDSVHLPGGSLCRNLVTGASLDNNVTTVEISTSPSATATYIGSSACLGCHSTYATIKQTAHKHGIMQAGVPSGLQDLTEFGPTAGVYNYMAGLDKFTAGTSTTGGTTIWYSDPDTTRGFDKFKTQTTAPATGTIYATVRVYKDSVDSKYKMQFTNVINPADPKSGMIREVLMNYGGGVYKQRYMSSFGASESLYILPVQYNASGDDAATDRTRKIFRDYHLDFWMTFDTAVATNNLFKDLPAASKSFDINCASCHFNGYQVVQNSTTSEFSATAVADVNGTLNPISGVNEEMNVGCESCHGPGSDHQAANGLGVAIVTPQNLPVERASMLCGRCHSRPEGNNSFGTHTDQPLDVNNEMLHAGSSRASYLANNTDRHDAKASDMWADGLHSKSHHQQYTDFIQSVKYRNGSALKTCTDCHDIHAPGTDRHQLNGTSDNSLCISCHAAKADVVAHMTAKTGASMGAGTKCIDCHFTKTAKSGAGQTVGKVGGISGVTYYQNDISSHRLDVPLKNATSSTNPMPVPYINTCGVCHSLSAM
ncbi:cytochrome c3 family protein [Geopsychrobacter electrodiphilus]|uniref:cytochrome c3 family protein n=1 Tax=Geopsychrobacter electrodiphilus TaxID=225196 RepID=UPI00036BB685|nr:cytochrome c3 family protein [Geopsychrobacter electrodiphilus]